MNDRWLAWVPVILLTALAALTYWLDQKVQPPRGREGSNGDEPDFMVDEFTATRMSLEGRPSYAVRAKRMVHFPEDNSARLDEPRLTHFPVKGTPVSIRADVGTLDKNGQNAYFTGDVQVHRQAFEDTPEMAMYTEYLHVIPDLAVARTDRPVRMVSGNSSLEAVGLELNNKTRTAKLLSKVKGTYATPPKARPEMPWERRRGGGARRARCAAGRGRDRRRARREGR
jgi:lipopolysaccharide export system protein LptC